MNNMSFTCQGAISGFKVSPNLEVTIDINPKYHLFIQVPEEQDTVYVSINHTELDENIHRLNCTLYIEDGMFNFEVHGHKYSSDLSADNLTDEDVQNLDDIYEFIERIFFQKIKKQILHASKLSCESTQTRFVFLNTLTGFTTSWKLGEAGFNNVNEYLLELSEIDPRRNVSEWKLIEYKCHTDHEFEFTKHMKLR
ncbi:MULTISPECIES: type III secretion system chaperone family protein [Vibrio]|uniref:hypothetical protein n=1 Tax=Vibrio TaxID=662 RepID=UPI000E3252F0|nr:MULTISPECIES: hypothetical protein [Vibrio]MDW1965795.1 hypothetical protein [Vibrio sp. Vb0587]RFD38018.1 hypothetical protein BS585_14390 [Vibrio parahaemolyticus]